LSKSKCRGDKSSIYARRHQPFHTPQEFVVGGWRQSDASGRTLSSLLVGYYDAGKLIVDGKLGSGFPQDVERDLLVRLAKLGPLSKPPFAAVPREYFTRAVWVRPELVVEGEFTTWTADNLLRRGGVQGGAGGQASPRGDTGGIVM
jgi:bifunctional non-homologous end joining protein LigD